MKKKISSIIFLILVLTIGNLAWKRNLTKSKFLTSIVIDVSDLPRQGTPYVKGDIAFTVKGDKCIAFERTCPHLGCKIEVDHNNQCFFCPCHGSKFSTQGEVIQGPAKEKLEKLVCEFDNKNLTIQVYYK